MSIHNLKKSLTFKLDFEKQYYFVSKMDRPYQSDQLQSFLLELLQQQMDEKSMDWMQVQNGKIEADASDMKFFIAFSQCSRYFKKTSLIVSGSQLTKANKLVEGFRPDTWDQLQAARSVLMLQFPTADATKWLDTFHKLFETADMHEQQSLYAALPIMPFPEAMVPRAVEGLRTNITSVFDSIALHNPFPFLYLDEKAWNQMVIKAIFLQRPLYKIYKADLKTNPDLAAILLDFAHERWAAGRPVIPELWRFIRHYLNEENIKDLEKAIHKGDLIEKQAALLACHSSGLDAAKELLDQNPVIKEDIEKGRIDWDYIGQKYHKE